MNYLQGDGIVSVSARCIDYSGAWLFWPLEPTEHLIRSIKEFGQLEPVLLEEQQDGYSLVSGFKRLRACQQLERSVLGLVICCSELEKGEIYLHSNVQGSPEPASMVLPARFFQERCHPEEWKKIVYRTIEPFLSGKNLRLLQKWMYLDSYWDGYLLSGHISLDTAPWLAEFGERGLKAVEPFLQCTYWSRNNAVSLVKWIYEVCKSRDICVQDLLEECRAGRYLDRDLSPKDRQKRILEVLRAHRYPNLYSLEQDFSRLQKETSRETGWKLIPDQNFETDRIYLQRELRAPRDLEGAIQGLLQIRDNGALENIRKWQGENLEP
ncbi:MAG: ParB N-terminal domain-containing protein [Thermodesulfobacteriota bacterium]